MVSAAELRQASGTAKIYFYAAESDRHAFVPHIWRGVLDSTLTTIGIFLLLSRHSSVTNLFDRNHFSQNYHAVFHDDESLTASPHVANPSSNNYYFSNLLGSATQGRSTNPESHSRSLR